MDWTIILQAFITSAFSSAIVSSIVTALLENQSDLRKRKIAAYSELLEQFNKVIPQNAEEGLRRLNSPSIEEMWKLHTCVLRLRVLANNEINLQAAQVFVYILQI